jgi:predicted ester cyclase
MSRAALEALVRRQVDAFNRHDPVALAEQHLPNSIVESPMFATLRGRKAIEEAYRTFLASFPDAEIAIDTIVVEAPRVAIFHKIKATHMGEFYGLPPTNKHIQVPMSRLVTAEDGLIAHERRIYDFTGLLVQVGVLRAKPVA